LLIHFRLVLPDLRLLVHADHPHHDPKQPLAGRGATKERSIAQADPRTRLTWPRSLVPRASTSGRSQAASFAIHYGAKRRNRSIQALVELAPS